MIRLVRHAESTLNKAGIQYGLLDPDLSPEGMEQIGALATEILLSKERGGLIYTSPLTRATQTAKIISELISIDPRPCVTIEDLKERYMGAAEGLPKAVAKERWGDNPPGSESREAVKIRAQRAMELIPDGSIVVTHSGVIHSLTGLKIGPAESVTIPL